MRRPTTRPAGRPGQITRASTELAICHIGVSLYRTPDVSELDTAVAQVFNERRRWRGYARRESLTRTKPEPPSWINRSRCQGSTEAPSRIR
jgi:hypothetical protein